VVDRTASPLPGDEVREAVDRHRADGPAPDLDAAVTAVLRGLEPGDVVAYGEVAHEAGWPGRARAVGRLLAGSEGLPWWRVVNASGRLVPGHEEEQARRLAAEGVGVRGGRVRQTDRRSHPQEDPRGHLRP
jgi:methylated-DNA-protein-cysteine methyltransferase related protein